jgi:hypothetical protein
MRAARHTTSGSPQFRCSDRSAHRYPAWFRGTELAWIRRDGSFALRDAAPDMLLTVQGRPGPGVGHGVVSHHRIAPGRARNLRPRLCHLHRQPSESGALTLDRSGAGTSWHRRPPMRPFVRRAAVARWPSRSVRCSALPASARSPRLDHRSIAAASAPRSTRPWASRSTLARSNGPSIRPVSNAYSASAQAKRTSGCDPSCSVSASSAGCGWTRSGSARASGQPR